MIQQSLQSLADSAAWKEVRDIYIAGEIQKLKDVTVDIKTELKVTPGEMYIAKKLAAEAVQDFVDGINRNANSKKKQEAKQYD